MAYIEAGVNVTLLAAADQSAKQFRFMDINTSGRAALQTSAGGRIACVSLEKPSAAGAPGTYQISGIAKVVAGAAVTAGDNVQSDTDGRAITAASGDHIGGIALTTVAAAGELVQVLLGSNHILA
jgi:hypothetical protein